MLDDPTGVVRLHRHRDFTSVVAKPDHFIPLLSLAGLAGEAGDRPAAIIIDGYAYGSLSMTAYTLDLPCPGAATAGTGGAADLPGSVPPDNSNI